MQSVYESLRSNMLEAKVLKHRPADKETLDRFMNEWLGMTQASFLGPQERVLGFRAEGSEETDWINVTLKPFGGTIRIEWMQVFSGSERKGVASAALKIVTKLADKYKVQMSLQAKPTGEPKIHKGSLKKLYRKFGFVSTRGDEMLRDPQ